MSLRSSGFVPGMFRVDSAALVGFEEGALDDIRAAALVMVDEAFSAEPNYQAIGDSHTLLLSILGSPAAPQVTQTETIPFFEDDDADDADDLAIRFGARVAPASAAGFFSQAAVSLLGGVVRPQPLPPGAIPDREQLIFASELRGEKREAFIRDLLRATGDASNHERISWLVEIAGQIKAAYRRPLPRYAITGGIGG